MTSISYNEVYSRFFTKVEAFDLFDPDAENTQMARELMCNWLHSAVNYPYIRKLFKTCVVDDEADTITVEMKYEIEETTDTEFVIDVLAHGMVLGWVAPKVASISNITQFFGEGDTKYYSQANHLQELRNLRDDSENQIRRLIRDRGFFNNSYLDGTAASANLRSRT